MSPDWWIMCACLFRPQAGIHGRRHSSVAKVLSDIGVVYEKMSEFSLALNFYQVARPQTRHSCMMSENVPHNGVQPRD